MEDKIVVLDKEQFAEIIYNTVNRCLEERNFVAMAHTSTEDEDYCTREELCKYLHVSPSTINRRQKDGVLKLVKSGRKNLYSKKEVNEALRLVNLLSIHIRRNDCGKL